MPGCTQGEVFLWEEKRDQGEIERMNMIKVEYMKHRNVLMKPFTLYNLIHATKIYSHREGNAED